MDGQILNSLAVSFVLRAGWPGRIWEPGWLRWHVRESKDNPSSKTQKYSQLVWCPGQAAWIWVRLPGCIRKERKGE